MLRDLNLPKGLKLVGPPSSWYHACWRAEDRNLSDHSINTGGAGANPGVGYVRILMGRKGKKGGAWARAGLVDRSHYGHSQNRRQHPRYKSGVEV